MRSSPAVTSTQAVMSQELDPSSTFSRSLEASKPGRRFFHHLSEEGRSPQQIRRIMQGYARLCSDRN